MAAPGSTFGYARGYREDADAIIQALLGTRRFVIVDSGDDQSSSDVRAMRSKLDASDGPASGRDVYLPPSGFIAGIYARVDRGRGVHKAPVNEVIKLATGLERDVAADQEILNAEGISCLRAFADRGTVV